MKSLTLAFASTMLMLTNAAFGNANLQCKTADSSDRLSADHIVVRIVQPISAEPPVDSTWGKYAMVQPSFYSQGRLMTALPTKWFENANPSFCLVFYGVDYDPNSRAPDHRRTILPKELNMRLKSIMASGEVPANSDIGSYVPPVAKVVYRDDSVKLGEISKDAEVLIVECHGSDLRAKDLIGAFPAGSIEVLMCQ